MLGGLRRSLAVLRRAGTGRLRQLETNRSRVADLPWYEFHRGLAPTMGPEAANVFLRRLRCVFGRVGALDFVTNSLAFYWNSTDADLAVSYLYGAERIRQERAMPAVWFERP